MNAREVDRAAPSAPSPQVQSRARAAQRWWCKIAGTVAGLQIASLDKNATYAVYCHSGNRSGAALEQMAAAGFTHLYDLAGGLTAWQAMGGHMVAGGP